MVDRRAPAAVENLYARGRVSRCVCVAAECICVRIVHISFCRRTSRARSAFFPRDRR